MISPQGTSHPSTARMIELKQEVNHLAVASGETPPDKIDFNDWGRMRTVSQP